MIQGTAPSVRKNFGGNHAKRGYHAWLSPKFVSTSPLFPVSVHADKSTPQPPELARLAQCYRASSPRVCDIPAIGKKSLGAAGWLTYAGSEGSHVALVTAAKSRL
jgi:hypothetical protein